MRTRLVLGLALTVACANAPADRSGPGLAEPSAHHDAPGQVVCPSIIVDGGAADAHNIELVRSGACAARDFFALHGFALRQPVRIRLLSQPPVGRANHIGSYDARTSRVALLDLAQAQRLTRVESPFGVAMDERLYVSFVVHEVAHAIADQYFVADPPPFLAHEYIAYAAQLSTIDDRLQTRILARYPVQGFADLSEMSSIYYGLDPGRFGVKAYLHFRDTADRAALLRGLLSGEITVGDGQSDWW